MLLKESTANESEQKRNSGVCIHEEICKKNVHLFNILNMLEPKKHSQMKSIIQTVYSQYYVGNFQREIDTCAENQGENTF